VWGKYGKPHYFEDEERFRNHTSFPLLFGIREKIERDPPDGWSGVQHPKRKNGEKGVFAKGLRKRIKWGPG